RCLREREEGKASGRPRSSCRGAHLPLAKGAGPGSGCLFKGFRPARHQGRCFRRPCRSLLFEKEPRGVSLLLPESPRSKAQRYWPREGRGANRRGDSLARELGPGSFAEGRTGFEIVKC